jgi:uncharacterized protein YceK
MKEVRIMRTLRRWVFTAGLAALLVAGPPIGSAMAAHGEFNDEYVYAMTRSVDDMDAHPGLKVTLYPVTFVLDTAFLPFAVMAGFMT